MNTQSKQLKLVFDLDSKVTVYVPSTFDINKAADNAEREHFKKRLETWWKRYGADHVRAHTYWDMR